MPRTDLTTEYDDDRVIVIDRRSDDNSLGWLAVGAGIVAALVFFRGGNGWGGGSGRPGGRVTMPADAPLPLPPSPASEPPPIVDPQKRDDARLTFVMVEPTNAQWPDASAMSFRGPDAKTYSLDEMIARIRSGGRSDVTLKASGSVVEAAWQSAKRLVAAAGIDVSEVDAPIVGSSRGVYRRGTYR